MKLTEDDLRPYEFDSGVYIGFFTDQEEAKQLIKQILDNQAVVEKVKQWRHNLDVLNKGVQGNHDFANRVILSLDKILGEDNES